MQFMVLEKVTGPDYSAVFIPRKLTRKIRYQPSGGRARVTSRKKRMHDSKIQELIFVRTRPVGCCPPLDGFQ